MLSDSSKRLEDKLPETHLRAIEFYQIRRINYVSHGWELSCSMGSVGNQQKWDTFVKERSRGCGSVVGLSALPVVALTPL